jgi:hypothetical protein
MAKYRVLVDSVIGSGLVKARTIIEYDGKSEGKPGPNLELVKASKGAPVPTLDDGDLGGENSAENAA